MLFNYHYIIKNETLKTATPTAAIAAFGAKTTSPGLKTTLPRLKIGVPGT